MWNEDHPALRERAASDEPWLVELAERLHTGSESQISDTVLKPFGLVALPLIEWDMSILAQPIFASLASSGSAKGFLMDRSVPGYRPSTFLECRLNPEEAAVIERECLLDLGKFFIDDLRQCLAVTWYSDFGLLCMPEARFAGFLSNSQLFFDLHGKADEVAPNNFQSALRSAFARLEAWSLTDCAPIVQSLEWQLDR